jgi:uncharacterized membrane protein YjjP (DUF1212 family)
MEDNQKSNLIKKMEVCLLAGEIMLKSGAETYRVEDTMDRMARALEIEQPQSFATPTAIIFSAHGETKTETRLIRIINRTTDLEKIARVNHLSRSLSEKKITAEEAFNHLKELQKTDMFYPVWLQLFCAALSSGCFLIMFGGVWSDFIPAFLSGGIGFYIFLLMNRFVGIKFFSEFSASLSIGFCAYVFVKMGTGIDLDKIIIGSVMPLVPGLLITNAIRDLIAGHLVAGISKGAEAFFTAFAIGSGIACIVLIFF